ncbi:MAG: hypothetical protein R2825_21205 [Saprospiraceae bacterium]
MNCAPVGQHPQLTTISIEGGAPGSYYSDMEITVLSNTPSTIDEFWLLPKGAEML